MGRSGAVVARRANATATRQAVITEMVPALKAKCLEMQKGLIEQSHNNVRFYYDLGVDGAEIKANPKKYLTAEQQAAKVDPFQLLLRAMSTSKESLKKAVVFVQKYARDDLKRLFGYRNAEEPTWRLHWGHVVFLISVEPESLRIKFEENAAEGHWEPNRLLGEIQKHYGGARRSGGRPLSIPKGISAQVHQMTSMTRVWLRRHSEVWLGDKHSVLANVMNVPADKYNDNLLKDLRGVKTLMEETSQAAEAEAQMCERVIEHVEQAMSLQAKADATKEQATPLATKAGTAKAQQNGRAKKPGTKPAAKPIRGRETFGTRVPPMAPPAPGTSRQRPADRAKAAIARARSHAGAAG